MSLLPGQIIDGKYRIVRLIGEGGMGSVHEGENTLISRRVAIKVLHAASAANEGILKRFEREAQAAGRIGSDHILEVLDLGTLEDGDRYMVMEYLEGEELAARIERLGRLSAEQLTPLIQQTLIGLRAAHAAQIVHRDLKPDNLFILREKAGQPDFLKIIDFGISKFGALTGDMSMTTTGAVMGTPFYMSPEQAKGAAGVDARTDIYAVGVIMYEALTGKVPFEGTSFNDLMFKIVLSDPEPLPDFVPEDLRAIVRKAMAREPGARYQTADEMLGEVEAWLGARGLLTRESSASLVFSRLAASAARRTPVSASETSTGMGAKTNGNFAATNGAEDDARSGNKRQSKLAWVVGAAVLFAAGAGLAFLRPLGSPSGVGADATAGQQAPAAAASGGPAAVAASGGPATPAIAVPSPAAERSGEPGTDLSSGESDSDAGSAEPDRPTASSASKNPTGTSSAIAGGSAPGGAQAEPTQAQAAAPPAVRATTSKKNSQVRSTPSTTKKTPEAAAPGKSGGSSASQNSGSGRDFGY